MFKKKCFLLLQILFHVLHSCCPSKALGSNNKYSDLEREKNINKLKVGVTTVSEWDGRRESLDFLWENGK